MESAPLDRLLEAIREIGAQRAFEAGATIFRSGQRPRWVFFVTAGEIRLLRHSSAGAALVVQRARGGFLAEASLDSPRYHCDAVGVRAGSLLRAPIADFRARLEEAPALQRAWSAHLAAELRRLRLRCERLALPRAAERILHYIASEGSAGRITLGQSRIAWAAELGMSHEALYRALARLRRAGTIEVEANTIRLRRSLR